MFDLVFMIIYVILNIWLAIVDTEFRVFAMLSIPVGLVGCIIIGRRIFHG